MDVSVQLHAPGRFTPTERTPGTHWIGGWYVPEPGRGLLKYKKVPRLPLEFN